MNHILDISPEELETIERYLNQQMSEEDYADFAEKLKSDSTLQNKVHSVQLLAMGIGESVLEDQVKIFLRELTDNKATHRYRKTLKLVSIKRWLIAATIILIAGIGMLFLLYRPHSFSERLYASYYKPDPGLFSAMSIASNYEFDRAMIEYKTKNYDSAIHTWERLQTGNPSNDTLNYFIASSWLAKGNSEKAIAYFKKVITVPSSYFLNDAFWYIGLSLLKEGRTKEAIPFIEKSGHLHKTDLIEKLNQ